MLKTLTLAALLATSLAASAQTITLDADGCSDNRFCYSVPNDANLQDLTLYASPSNGGIVQVTFADGTYYTGHGPVGLSISNYAVYRQPLNDAVLYVSADWITWTTKGSGSGRGGYTRHTHWALTGGSLAQ